jgi:hypothetical protein
MNRYRMSYVQTSTLPPCMHQELTKHGRFYKQNNQLPTKSHVELKDNSNNLPQYIYKARSQGYQMREVLLHPYTLYGKALHLHHGHISMTNFMLHFFFFFFFFFYEIEGQKPTPNESLCCTFNAGVTLS